MTNKKREEYEPLTKLPYEIVRKRGLDIIHDPWCNKGQAFPKAERDRLGLRGLLPPKIFSLEQQEVRFIEDYYNPRELIPPEEVKNGGVTGDMARKWNMLQGLQDRNETLFYRVLQDNFEEMAPIIYTPTVGWVCTNYHHLRRRARGMYFSVEDKGEMAAMAWNWPQDDVQAIVVTDGSRILGLGDLGVNGLGIPIGKLDLYCAAAGFSPAKVLPAVIDVGTNNEMLRKDPNYAGLQIPRVTGDEYYEIIDEFVRAVMSRWPKAVLQFEDFSIEHALELLNRYRKHHLVFNDDIQGTAATALAGLYGALTVMGKSHKDLANQRIVCVGAGSAGMGVVNMIATGMQMQGLTMKEATNQFWMLDYKGLITHARADLEDHVRPFARSESECEGQGLLEVVRAVRPTILLGLSGAGRLFTKEVLETMNSLCTEQRPVIFPMSNPISKMECTSEEAILYTQGRAIFASGSPQPDVEFEGRIHHMSQANNMYIFPGLALGGYLGKTGVMTEGMLMSAAETLPTLLDNQDLVNGKVYPKLADIRKISAKIAMEVIKTAAREGHLASAVRDKLAKGDDHLLQWINKSMFKPEYSPLVHLPVGVHE